MTDAPRKRRWPKILAILAALALLAAWWVDRQLEPTRLASTVLSAIGESQGLEITFAGTPDYALRPEPRLRLPNLVARQPGAAAPLLTAQEVEVSLPWSTIWGEGPVVITRIALEAPALDLAALEAWQASRPDTGPFELPTLTRGLQVRDGRLQGLGWSLEQLSIALPALLPGEPAAAELSGEFRQDTLAIVFTGPLQLGQAGLDSPLSFEGAGRIRSEGLDAPWKLAFTGAMALSQSPRTLDLDTLSLAGEPPLPDFEGRGALSLGDTLAMHLEGALPAWPEGWPPLPAPLDASTSPVALVLDYRGADDFSDPLSLDATRDEAVLRSSVPVPALLAWLEDDGGQPLPPLSGTLDAPRLVVEGVELEGVRISVGEAADEVPPAGEQ